MWEDNITGTYDLPVGPQSDGTSITPPTAETPLPVDAGGGFAGTYGKDILDIFKFGVGVYSQDKARSDLLDYKRFEATQAGLWRQGQPALFARNPQGGNGNLLVLAAIVIGAVVLLQEKG